MMKYFLVLVCTASFLAAGLGCAPVPAGEDVYLKREENIKQGYSGKIDLLQKENDQLQARIAELTDSLNKLSEQLKLAQKEVEFLSAAKKPETTEVKPPTASDSRPKPLIKSDIKCRILSVNEKLNLIIISVGSNNGVKPKTEYDVISQGKTVGRIRADQVETDWASVSLIKGESLMQLKESGSDVIISGE
ncbi:MAG: hypothetical protein V1701_00625 [Planctomycetota bacterium]